MDQESVEPTNNAAERVLRRGVIWRKRSFGTQKQEWFCVCRADLDHGDVFTSTIRNVLGYLTTACKAATLGIPAPLSCLHY